MSNIPAVNPPHVHPESSILLHAAHTQTHTRSGISSIIGSAHTIELLFALSLLAEYFLHISDGG